jgi:hypothetical protein
MDNAIRMQLRHRERFPERHKPEPHQYSGEIDRIGLKILENYKNIQSIINLLRIFTLVILFLNSDINSLREAVTAECALITKRGNWPV